MPFLHLAKTRIEHLIVLDVFLECLHRVFVRVLLLLREQISRLDLTHVNQVSLECTILLQHAAMFGISKEETPVNIEH